MHLQGRPLSVQSLLFSCSLEGGIWLNNRLIGSLLELAPLGKSWLRHCLNLCLPKYYRIQGARGTHVLSQSQVFYFHTVPRKKFGQITGWRPRLGNPGSATDKNALPLLVCPRNSIVSDCIRIVSVRIILRIRHVPSPLVIYLSPLFF